MKDEKPTVDMSHFIEDIWNAKNELENNRAQTGKVRDYISPSDLGKSYIDRYYKMIGEAPSNPFEDRVLRIFDAGNLFEWIVYRALMMAGVVVSRGSRRKKNYVTLPTKATQLNVWGYYDFIIGGIGNWSEARERIKAELRLLGLDDEDDYEVLETKAFQLIDGLEEKFGNREIPLMVVDVKSVNSQAFWGHKNRDERDRFLGYEHNKLQLLPYMLGKGKEKQEIIPLGALLYISKDDLTLQQVPVSIEDKDLIDKMWEDIERMSDYFFTSTVPPKEEEIAFDDRKRYFDVNWKVKRSLYLTKIYGYESQDAFELRWHGQILDMNRALKHLREYENLMLEVDKVEDLTKKKKMIKSIDLLNKKINGEDKAIIGRFDLYTYV